MPEEITIVSQGRESSSGIYKILIPLGYVAFVGVPILLLITIYYFVSGNKPAQVQAEKSAPNSDQSAPNQNAQSGSEAKRRPFPPHDSQRNDPSSPNTATTDPRDSKLETPETVLDPEKVAPPPREIADLEFGTLRLTTMAPVRADVQAWVEINGKKEVDFKTRSTQVELRLHEGRYAVKVVAVYQDMKRTVLKVMSRLPPIE